MQLSIVSIITAFMATTVLATHQLGSSCATASAGNFGCSNDECTVVSKRTAIEVRDMQVEYTDQYYSSNASQLETATTTGLSRSPASVLSARTAPATATSLSRHAPLE